MKIIYENNRPSQFNTVFDKLISLLVGKSKSFEHKMIFNSRGWKVCPNAANSTRWQNYSYFLAQKSPAPPCQLPVGYVPLLFVLWTFICISILLFILMPCCLKNPPIQANSTKPWVLRNTLWGLIESFGLDRFVVFSNHTVNLRATYAFNHSIQSLAILTSTPKR